MSTNISDESPAQLDRAPRHTGNFGRRELASAEIIRIVKERFRLCNYLINVGGAWIIVGAIWQFLSEVQRDESPIAFTVMLIGFGIFSAAFGVTLAIYRCPVCDKYLSRFRADKFHCAACGAQVKESA